jgi:3',5'-nucleoside bisphosphate phosphatase
MILKSGEGKGKITLYPGSSQIITAQSGQAVLVYDVVTAFIRSDKNLSVEIPLRIN